MFIAALVVTALLVLVLKSAMAGWLIALIVVPGFVLQWGLLIAALRRKSRRALWRAVARDQETDGRDAALYGRVMRHFRVPADPADVGYAVAIERLLTAYWAENHARRAKGLPLMRNHDLRWGYRDYAAARLGEGFDPYANAIITAWTRPKVKLVTLNQTRLVSDESEGSLLRKEFDAARSGTRLPVKELQEHLGLTTAHILSPHLVTPEGSETSDGKGRLH